MQRGKKCSVVSFGTDVNKNFTYTIPQKNQQFLPTERGDTVIFDEKLHFREHIHCKSNMAYKMVRVIKRNFKYLSISSLVLVYKNLDHMLQHEINSENICKPKQPIHC